MSGPERRRTKDEGRSAGENLFVIRHSSFVISSSSFVRVHSLQHPPLANGLCQRHYGGQYADHAFYSAAAALPDFYATTRNFKRHQVDFAHRCCRTAAAVELRLRRYSWGATPGMARRGRMGLWRAMVLAVHQHPAGSGRTSPRPDAA